MEVGTKAPGSKGETCVDLWDCGVKQMTSFKNTVIAGPGEMLVGELCHIPGLHTAGHTRPPTVTDCSQPRMA